MHAAGTFFVVDQELAAFIFHTFGRAKINHFFFYVKSTPVTTGMCAAVGSYLTTDVGLNSFLIDPDIVFPGADPSYISGHNPE